MQLPSRVFMCVGVLAVIVPLCQPNPIQDLHLSMQNPSRLRQEDGDEDGDVVVTPPPGPSFGSQVAQIINGVAAGDLSSILQGSFNLVPNQPTKNAINAAWGTIAGYPITQATTPTPPTTAAPVTAAAVLATAAPTAAAAATTPEELEVVDSEDSSPSPSGGLEETSVASGTGTEDDDEDEAAAAEEIDPLQTDEDSSVYSRSKVLRVI